MVGLSKGRHGKGRAGTRNGAVLLITGLPTRDGEGVCRPWMWCGRRRSRCGGVVQAMGVGTYFDEDVRDDQIHLELYT